MVSALTTLFERSKDNPLDKMLFKCLYDIIQTFKMLKKRLNDGLLSLRY